MSDMLSIGTSALLAYRTALNVVGQNIANASTTGYTRETANLQNVAGVPSSGGTIGQGVQVQSVQRLSDSYVQQQLVSDDSSYGRINTFQTYAASIDSALSDSSAGLSTPLQSFFSSLNSLAANASSSSTRQATLTSAQTLASTFNSLQQQLTGMDGQISGAVGTTVSQINSYASQLAQLNVSIAQATAQGNGQAPNDLLDQRDQMLRNIAGDVGISTTSNANGSVNVYLASGQALVLDGSANSLSVQADAYGQGQDVVLNSGSTKSVITSQLSGGTLGGLLDARRELINPAMNQLGQLAVSVSSAVNAQNADGMDQYGQLGGNIFTPAAASVIANTGNSGSATVSAGIADPTQLGSDDYLLKYSGSGWSLVDRSSGASVALSGAGTAASPLTGAGLSIVVGGTPAAGDQFLVQPTRNAAGQMQVAMTDPARIAAAAPVQAAAAAGNTGSGSIGTPVVTDAGNASLLSTSTISFSSASTYSINGSGSYAYSSGGSISVNGVQVQISGTPAAGDSFTLSANSGSSSDSSNAKLLAALSSSSLLNGATSTVSAANATMVSRFGSLAQQAQSQLGAQTSIRSQDQAQRDSVSGVNLDEEAASMMQFQQAYQAAAQVISTSNTLFQSLISALQS